MINYPNPDTSMLADAQGLDKAILPLQELLSQETWLQKVFGRAYLQSTPTPEGKNILYPEIMSKGEPYNLMPNDHLDSYCFFFPTEPLKISEYKGDYIVPSSQRVDIIFWGNLLKCGASSVEQLRYQAILRLKDYRFYDMTESFIDFNRVFSPFTITHTYQTYTKHPSFAFRISGILTFNFWEC